MRWLKFLLLSAVGMALITLNSVDSYASTSTQLNATSTMVIKSTEGSLYPATNILTNDTKSWYTGHSGSTLVGDWVGYNYGSAVTVNGFDVTFPGISNTPKTFNIEYSTNNSTWTTLQSVTVSNLEPSGVTSSNWVNSFSIPLSSTVSAQYWRLKITSSSNMDGTTTNYAGFDMFRPTYQTPAPSAPTNLVGSSGTGSILLSWDTMSNATGYRVYDSNNTLLTDTSMNSYNISGLNASTAYTYYVSSYNSTGESSKTSITVSTAAPPNTSVSPSDIQASDSDWSSIYLSWIGDTNDTGYRVYNSSGTAIYDGPNTYFNISGLSEDTDYTYYVTGYNSSGESSKVSIAAYTVLTGLTNFQVTNVTDTGATISWDVKSNATGYYVKDSNGTLVADLNSNSQNSYTFSGLSASTIYQYSIMAYDTELHNGISSTQGFTTSAPSSTSSGTSGTTSSTDTTGSTTGTSTGSTGSTTGSTGSTTGTTGGTTTGTTTSTTSTNSWDFLNHDEYWHTPPDFSQCGIDLGCYVGGFGHAFAYLFGLAFIPTDAYMNWLVQDMYSFVNDYLNLDTYVNLFTSLKDTQPPDSIPISITLGEFGGRSYDNNFISVLGSKTVLITDFSWYKSIRDQYIFPLIRAVFWGRFLLFVLRNLLSLVDMAMSNTPDYTMEQKANDDFWAKTEKIWARDKNK